METNKKRRKNDHFRHNKKVKQKWVESGCCGLFFTCNGNERQAVREAYNIIEQTLEIWKNGFPEENLDDKNVGKGFNSCGDEEDVADSVKRFCDQGFSSYYFIQILRFYNSFYFVRVPTLAYLSIKHGQLSKASGV